MSFQSKIFFVQSFVAKGPVGPISAFDFFSINPKISDPIATKSDKKNIILTPKVAPIAVPAATASLERSADPGTFTNHAIPPKNKKMVQQIANYLQKSHPLPLERSSQVFNHLFPCKKAIANKLKKNLKKNYSHGLCIRLSFASQQQYAALIKPNPTTSVHGSIG